MRMLVMSEPQFPVPPEQFPLLVEGFVAWREQYRDRMESFEFFAEGGGGFAIVNATDEAELHRMLLEYPFSIYSKMTIHPVVSGDVGLRQLQELTRAMMNATAPPEPGV